MANFRLNAFISPASFNAANGEIQDTTDFRVRVAIGSEFEITVEKVIDPYYVPPEPYIPADPSIPPENILILPPATPLPGSEVRLSQLDQYRHLLPADRELFEMPAGASFPKDKTTGRLTNTLTFNVKAIRQGKGGIYVVDASIPPNGAEIPELVSYIYFDITLLPPIPVADRSFRCESANATDPQPSIFINWFGNLNFPVRMVAPTNKSELVSAILFAESNGMRVGIMGSAWSYTNCVASDGDTSLVIVTHRLNKPKFSLNIIELHPPLPPDAVIPFALIGGMQSSANRLIHVEAGMKIHELNAYLARQGLAMPTLGGSRGQSIAGAMGTSVHGGDINLPPIADAVKAIHLVSAGGQELRTRSFGPIFPGVHGFGCHHNQQHQ